MTTLEEICAPADAAMAAIGDDTRRLHELSDDDLEAVALKVRVLKPIIETELVERLGSINAANAKLQRLMDFPRKKIVRLVHAAQAALRRRHVLTLTQLAALTLDAQAGVAALAIEAERREASRARRVN